MILQSINPDQLIGDTELRWIIFSVVFFILFWSISFWLLGRRVKQDRNEHLWPTLEQIEAADDDQVTWWVNNLPVASNDRQMAIIEQIVRRYLNV